MTPDIGTSSPKNPNAQRVRDFEPPIRAHRNVGLNLSLLRLLEILKYTYNTHWDRQVLFSIITDFEFAVEKPAPEDRAGRQGAIRPTSNSLTSSRRLCHSGRMPGRGCTGIIRFVDRSVRVRTLDARKRTSDQA